jgi:ATP-binding cassette subfamily B protein
MKKIRATTWQIIKTYWAVMRRYLLAGSGLWALIILAVITTIIIPLYYKQFFDTLSGSASAADSGVILIEIVFKILALNILGWLFWRGATFLHNYYEANVITGLKQDSFDYLLGHSYGFFADNFGGALVQKVNRLARSFETLWDNIVWTLLPLLVRIIGVTGVLWFYNRFLAGILLAWMAVFIGMNMALSKWKLKYDIEASSRDSETTGVLADAITNHINIQLFTAFRRESNYFKKVSERLKRSMKLAWDLESVVEAAQGLLGLIAEFFLFYFAIRYWQEGVLTLGVFVLIQVYLLQLIGQLWDFGRTVRNIYRSFADAEEMVAILNAPREIVDIPTAKPMRLEKGEIEFRKVEFSFHETRKVLRRVDMKIEAGEKVALIGPSGAGKSTIVKLLLRLYDLEGGAIFIDGQDIHTVTQESLRENLSLVPQDPILFHRTLLENIRYGKPSATQKEVERAARQAHCSDFIELLPDGYNTYVGERGIKLSGGERQRVAIARAILKNAPILILDEATSSLDSHSEILIQDALKTLMRGKTVIVIAHRLSTIRTMDRIVVVDDGRIKEEGTHAGLLKKPRSLYARLWKLQAGGFLKAKEQDRLTAVLDEKGV